MFTHTQRVAQSGIREHTVHASLPCKAFKLNTGVSKRQSREHQSPNTDVCHSLYLIVTLPVLHEYPSSVCVAVSYMDEAACIHTIALNIYIYIYLSVALWGCTLQADFLGPVSPGCAQCLTLTQTYRQPVQHTYNLV